MFNRVLLMFVLFCLVLTTGMQAQSSRVKYNLNHDWRLNVGEKLGAEKVAFDDSNWKVVTLPYAWNQDEAFKNDIVDLSTDIAWYRKSFVLPEGAEKGKVFVEFEGVRQMGEVYINGNYIGRHENGVMAFGFDLTDFVKPAPASNILAVKTDNNWEYREKLTKSLFQWNNSNFNANYGGIPKNVYLHTTSKVFQTLPLYTSLGTTGTYIYATDMVINDHQAVVHARTQVRNETKKVVDVELEVRIEELDGKVIATYTGDKCTLAPGGMREIHAQDTVKQINFWSWGYGYLYNVHTIVKVGGEKVDDVLTCTGFRKTDFGKGMIWLNDRVIMMKGYAQRTSNEWPSVGMSVPAWLSDYSNSLIIEGNGNMVRWMHVTPWKQDIESCDRVGLIQAMPAGDAEKDVTGIRWEHRKNLMRDAIIYNRNNPSIVFYECGNESISELHMAEMKALRNQYDAFGGRAIGSREMLDSKVAEYGGEMLYINKSADIPFWAMEYSRDEGLRKYWDEFTPPFHKNGEGPLYKGKDASDYNRNQDSHAIEDVIRWFDYWEARPGTGKRVSSGGANIVFSDTNTHHRGSENYRRSGEVDAMRIPKDNFWAHKVIWNGWVDTDSMAIHILGHWNYAADVVKDITVVSTAPRVKLFLNGKSLGKGEQTKHFLFTFKNIAYKPGELKAIGYNAKGQEVCSYAISTVGKPDALKLTLIERPDGILADGQDLAIVQVEVLDKEGRRCPTAFDMISFDTKGDVEFVGGIAQGPDNYIGATMLPVECGVNRVFIRSTTKAGKISVKASAKGLKSASVSLQSKAVAAENGLSNVLPSAGLKPYFQKGPTPSTPSFTPSRIALEVISIKAGINQEDAMFSIDDNEFTEWSNKGVLSKGIIEYQLEREAIVSEVVMKLSGWRTRRYPIRILVDDNEVFKGDTPVSLGYVTCSFTPTKGSVVRIELIGSTTDQETFNIVEITGKVDKAGLEKGSDDRGNLRIVEIEFYEKVDGSK